MSDNNKPADPPKPNIEPPKPQPEVKPPEVKDQGKEIDPLVVEYAEELKKSLGDYYNEDLDKLDIKSKIDAMKIIKKTIEKIPQRQEGKPPVQPPIDMKNVTKNHIDSWAAGDRSPKSNSEVGVTLFK